MPRRRAPQVGERMTAIHPMNEPNQTEIQIMIPSQPIKCPLEPIAPVEDAAAQHRAAYAALKYRRQLICWTESVIAYKSSQRFRHNRRLTTVKRSHIRGLLGIAALFEVNRKHEYIHLANRFDIFGWRSTSLAEICDFVNRLPGSRRRFTEKQAARSLDGLCRLGFVERKNTFSLEQFPVPLAVLFRADRVLEAIANVIALRKAEPKSRRRMCGSRCQQKPVIGRSKRPRSLCNSVLPPVQRRRLLDHSRNAVR